MKKINTLITGICILLWSATDLKAQQGSAATGGEAAGAGGTVSYTIGQMDYITTTGNGGTISQGLQQPYQINVATGMQETGINLTCALYPNPTTDFVVLTVQKEDVENMSFSLLDVQGKLIQHQKLSSSSTTISMVNYADALYLIKVFNNNTEVKSFKINKNK
jgi:hypothetical protein